MAEYTREDLNLGILEQTIEDNINRLKQLIQETENDGVAERLRESKKISELELKKVRSSMEHEGGWD